MKFQVQFADKKKKKKNAKHICFNKRYKTSLCYKKKSLAVNLILMQIFVIRAKKRKKTSGF